MATASATQPKRSAEQVFGNLIEPKQRPSILCLDDHREIVDTLAEQLRGHLGEYFRIEIAETADEALEIIEDLQSRKRDVAVIISDQALDNASSMNGDQFLIKAHEMLPKAKKIMLTGQADVSELGNAINNANLFRYMSKPWEAEDLRLTVEEAARLFLTEGRVVEQDHILSTINEATEIISSKLELNDLLHKLLEIQLEYAEADRLIAIGCREDLLSLEGIATKNGSIDTSLQEPLNNSSADYPASIIQKVAQSKETIIVDRVDSDAQWSSNDYLKAKGIKSFACIPVMNVGKLVAVLFLEFQEEPPNLTPERIRISTTLASKSAIALENAYLYSNLQEIVAQRTEKLQETLEDLMAANSHKDRIIQIVSHDIRSPLSGIANLSKDLQDPDIADQPETVKKFGGIISNSASTLMNLVNDILDLAKLESGSVILNKETVQIGDFLGKLVQLNTPMAEKKGINLHVDGGDNFEVKLDKSKMTQAINNLMSNAVKFTPQGGDVILKYDQQGDRAVIEVADTGVGIKADDLDSLFEKFTNVQRKGTKGEKGTGLGMSIAKEIIEMHEGKIGVSSEVGSGTTFTIKLPLA